MKSFIFSTALFFALIILVIANSIYIHKICAKISDAIKELSPDDIDRVEEICALWKKHRYFFAFSVHESQLERLDDLTQDLKSAATRGDGAEFNKNIALINDLIDELVKNEEISFQGII